VDRYVAAWNVVVAEQPLLRTACVSINGAPVQVVVDPGKLAVTQRDLRSEGDPRASVRGLMLEELEKRFDLERPPLVRLQILRLAEDVYNVSSTWFHGICDLWCIHLCEREVSRAYASGEARPRPERPPAYGAYARSVALEESSRLREFWTKELRGIDGKRHAEAARRRGLRAEVAALGPDRERLSATLTESTWSELLSVCRRRMVTFSTMFHAAWALAQRRYFEIDEVVFWTITSGRWRDFPGIDALIGPTMEGPPVRLAVPEGGELSSWLRKLQVQLANVQRYGNVPFPEIAGWVEGAAALDPWSLVVVENLPDDLWTREASSELRFREPRIDADLHLPMVLYTVPYTRGVQIDYNTGSMDGAVAAALFEGLIRTLTSLAKGTERIADLG
jgi:nonribosomal peptide synthetase CepA